MNLLYAIHEIVQILFCENVFAVRRCVRFFIEFNEQNACSDKSIRQMGGKKLNGGEADREREREIETISRGREM